MKALTHFRIEEIPNEGVVVWFDVAGRSVNVFFEEVFDDLERLLEELEDYPSSTSCLIRSAKASGFGAGADLKRIGSIDREDEVQSFLKRGQDLFDRCSNLKIPTVVLVEGVCLGGVMEFALTARFRVGVKSERFQIGMPETKLGLIPGWGGTQRLPRLVGYQLGLEMLVHGNALSIEQSRACGLIDAALDEAFEKLSPSQLIGIASEARARFTQSNGDPTDTHFDVDRWIEEYRKQSNSNPSMAQQAVIEAVRLGSERSFQSGLDAERNQFFHLLVSQEVRSALERFTKK